MAMPQTLAAALTEASHSIDRHGELPADVRKNVLQRIEALSSDEHADAGYLRRARLALICALEVVARIEPYKDVLASAQMMLVKGKSALAGHYDLRALEAENGKFHVQVVDLFQWGEDAFVPVYAGMASFAAINTVLYDTDFDVAGMREMDLSPDQWDASFYGSLAVAGSAVWEGKGGTAGRSAYWSWYLDVAVPLARDVDLALDLENS